MTLRLAAGLALGLLAGAPAHAAGSRPVDCELVVDGQTYLSGPCEFRAEDDGSFQIAGPDYFAYVSVLGSGKAEGSWNADPKSTHAQAPLGELTRKGACWANDRARICARALSPEKEAEVRAAWPGGAILYPDLPGASQSCIGLEGDLAAGQPLVLHACRTPADRMFARGEDGELRLAGHPDYCVASEAPGMMKPEQLIVEPCATGLPRWRSRASGSEPGEIATDAGGCAAIPALADPDATFPYPLTVVPCSDGAPSVVRFYWETE